MQQTHMAQLCRSVSSQSSIRLTCYGISRTKFVRNVSTRSRLFTVAEEVADAIATGKPVVALESTIYTHGFPYPENVALASRLESLVRVHGGVPATIGIIDGRAHVGMGTESLIRLVSTAGSKDTWKISRRDLGFIGGMGLRGRKLNGGTTIAGTMILAHLAGIKIFATGGLGGVHRGGENSMDISADLTELGRTPVAVISSGCKSFLDIPRTLEYLETQGVGVGTFADGRSGNVDFPAFFSRDSGVTSPQTVENEADAAAVIHAQFQLPIHSGLLFANPVPEKDAMLREDIDKIIAVALAEADEMGISGSANTPYILKRIRELSNGASVHANTALIEANVVRGTKVAVELAKLESQEGIGELHGLYTNTNSVQVSATVPRSSVDAATDTTDLRLTRDASMQQVDLLVAGSLASDTICDYKPFDTADTNVLPASHTSNPSQIAQSMGGVGCNVAIAALYAGAKVALASVVANDIAGRSLVDQARRIGLETSYIRALETTDGARTAQYVAMNDAKKDLVVAMADMSILTRPELEEPTYWQTAISSAKPKWIVIDSNWSAPIVSAIIESAKAHNIPIALEPVSTAKAARIFDCSSITSARTTPNHVINLATPNALELKAMHDVAQDKGLFDSEAWWLTINSLGLSSSGSRDKFVLATNTELVDQGVPQQCIRLLPYIPNIVTKLGSQGVLLTSVLRHGDERLTDPLFTPYILSRNDSAKGVIGGVYMRLFPAAEAVKQEEVVSVNGVGDTLLGVLMAGLAKQGSRADLDSLMPIAQKAAVMTLKSKEAVAERVKSLR